MSEKKTRKLTSKQAKLVEGIIAGKTVAQAARDAGYSENKPENAGQSGYQAIKQLGDRVRNVMDEAGFTLEHLIDKDLRLVLEAKETKFFPFRTGGKTPGERIVQVIDRIEVVNLSTKATGLDIAFRLRGDYAPKQIDTDPAPVSGELKVYLGNIPRYNQPR